MKYTARMYSARRIAHLDMDAFFASVELLHYPVLRGRAVVVGGSAGMQPQCEPDGRWRFARLRDYAGRGVVTTSTYEARAMGVFSGMGLMKSARLAPDAVLLPANFDAYRDYSRKFKAAVASIAPRIENRGIDEVFVDLSEIPEETHALAKRIKQAVFDETGLTCSIGIAPNKLLSKICSDLEKPDGTTVLAMADIPARIWPLAVKKVNGIGPKSTEKLARLGIHTIGELAATPGEHLVNHFGRTAGVWLNAAAHGLDDRPLVIESEPKSISRESTFARDLHAKRDKAELAEIFTSLCMCVADDLRRKGYASKTIGIKLRYSDFHAVTRDLTLPGCVSDGVQIRKAAGACLKRVSLAQRIRLLGVRASGLVPADEEQQRIVSVQSELPF